MSSTTVITTDSASAFNNNSILLSVPNDVEIDSDSGDVEEIPTSGKKSTKRGRNDVESDLASVSPKRTAPSESQVERSQKNAEKYSALFLRQLQVGLKFDKKGKEIPSLPAYLDWERESFNLMDCTMSDFDIFVMYQNARTADLHNHFNYFLLTLDRGQRRVKMTGSEKKKEIREWVDKVGHDAKKIAKYNMICDNLAKCVNPFGYGILTSAPLLTPIKASCIENMTEQARKIAEKEFLRLRGPKNAAPLPTAPPTIEFDERMETYAKKKLASMHDSRKEWQEFKEMEREELAEFVSRKESAAHRKHLRKLRGNADAIDEESEPDSIFSDNGYESDQEVAKNDTTTVPVSDEDTGRIIEEAKDRQGHDTHDVEEVQL